MPSPKPAITLRRPTSLAERSVLAERFVATENLISITSNAPVPPAPAAASHELMPAESSAAAPRAQLPSEPAPTVAPMPPESTPSPSPGQAADVPHLRPGIVQRRSGRVRRRLTVYIEPQLATRLAVHGATNGIDLSDIVETAIRNHLDALRSVPLSHVG